MTNEYSMNWDDPKEVDRFNEVWAVARPLFDELGRKLEGRLPRLAEDMDTGLWTEKAACEQGGPGALALHNVGVLAEVLLAGVAEILTWQLDAGSEREATTENEELREALLDELTGWAVEANSEGRMG